MFDVPPYRVPVVSKPVVCVVGGGGAGLAAALGAARIGLRVVLIERYGFCGGATVAGLSGTIAGLFSSGSKCEQIVFGFAGEFYDALNARGGSSDPFPFGRTMLVPHDSFVWKEVADTLLRAAGVEVWYHTNFLGAFTGDDQNLKTILVRAMEGQVAIQPRAVIDASGDAEVVHSLQGGTTIGKDGVVQTPTMIFRLSGVDMPTFLRLDQSEIQQWIRAAHATGAYHLPRHHVYLFPLPNGNEILCNMTKITYPDGSVPMGISSHDMTFAEMEGRIQARSYATFLKEKVPGFTRSYIVETATQVGIRQTRSIVGKTRLMNDDVTSGRKCPGAASFSAWPIESHEAGALKIVYLENDTYDIPFESLIPVSTPNLLVAGRCLSAEHEALASARVTAQCLGMGYAAGAAAGLLINEGMISQDLSGFVVADWMKEKGLKTAKEH
jgi:hypothetical protein